MPTTSIDHLLEEQKRSANLVVIEAIPDDKEHVRIIPWRRGLKCICGKGVIAPRSAIKEISTTGKTILCCGKTLQVVEVTFSTQKMLTYEELFSAIRVESVAAIASARRGFRRRLRGALPVEFPAPWWPVDGFGDGDGSGDGPGEEDGDGDGFGVVGSDGVDILCLADCVSRNMAASGANKLPPAQRAANRQFWTDFCTIICQANIS